MSNSTYMASEHKCLALQKMIQISYYEAFTCVKLIFKYKTCIKIYKMIPLKKSTSVCNILFYRLIFASMLQENERSY